MKTPKNKAEEYINRFNSIYNNKYKYPNEIYNSTDFINIDCPEHGIFTMRAYRHLTQQCPKCGVRGNPFKTFTERAIAKFGNKFTYLEDTFISAQDKMDIICPIHGKFSQALYSHVRLSHGCPQCGFEASANHCRDNLESFIKKAREVHGDAYVYDRSIYLDSITPLEIYCKKHKTYFFQQPAAHIRGNGCPTCGFEKSSEKRKYTQEEFIEKIKAVQGDEWDYSETVYIDFETKVKLKCKEHGAFYKNPRHLLYYKSGCPRCAKNVPHTTEEFIKLAKEVHGNNYSYPKTIYNKSHDKITITCKIHGDFDQMPYQHLQGNGCPRCSESKGEMAVAKILDNLNIEYIREYKLPDNRFKYDFYLPKHNTFIEFHGEQHYKYIEFFHRNDEEFIFRKLADEAKVYLVRSYNGTIIIVNFNHLESGNLEKILLKKLKENKII